MECFPAMDEQQKQVSKQLLDANNQTEFLGYIITSFLDSIQELPYQTQIEKKVAVISSWTTYECKTNGKRKTKMKDLCRWFQLSKRTYCDRMTRNNRPRKIRSDSIINNPDFQKELHRIFNSQPEYIGHKRMTKYLNQAGIHCSTTTVWKAMKQDPAFDPSTKLNKK